ncbi:carotenoid biosynthesis protein [Mucilaginibacter panaciglaebae]|uniref:Carotenoid biosynthesis protein n=1 Tax=Mucilaginibacter panaciglaebae TaxID=502331 RepID=A0ABP7WVB8_9SPHI
MERPKDIKSFHSPRALHEREINTIRIIVIFHLIGLLGLYFLPTKPYFILLVPFHLMLMTFIVFINHDELNLKFCYFFVMIVLAGWLIEYIGIHTGQLFGAYYYGHTLGFTIRQVPVVMGFTWFILIYATGVSMRKLRINLMLVRVLCGALLLVILDLLIEPVADQLDYWHWLNNETLIQNYCCWFIASAVFLLVFELFDFKKQSMVAPALLACQFIFFAALQ